MRIRHLALDRFGPFTDQHLDLSAPGRGGLHVIYGQNEAGKSTSLRAVLALLFGIPARTEDAHLHPLGELRLGGQLERRVDGELERLDIVRRRRGKHALSDATGAPLEEAVLAPFLAGVTRAAFQARFALDQRELEAGAKALLSGAEEGLFAAGSAGAGVAQVLLRLEEEQSALYRPRGQKYVLNQLLDQLRDADKHLRLGERPAEKWQEQKRALERASAEVARYEAERSQLRAALSRKNRLGSMLTDVSRLVEAQAELASLAGVPLLPGESSLERARAVVAEREATHEANVHAEEVRLIETRLAALGPAQGIETVAEERLALLRNQLGSEHKALADLPKRSAKLAGLDEQVRDQLAALGRAGARLDDVLIDVARETRLRQLATEHGQVSAEAIQLRRSVLRLEEEVRDLMREKQQLSGSSDEIEEEAERQVLARARERLPVLRQLAAREAQIRSNEQRATELVAELGEGLGPEPPSEHVLASLEARRQELDRRWRDNESEQVAAQDQRSRSDARAVSLKAGLDLPSEEQLKATRQRRDELLRVVGAEPLVQGQLRALGDAIREADLVADRLRFEAARVSELISLGMDVAAADAHLRELRERRRLLEEELRAWVLELGQLFSGVLKPPRDAVAARALRGRWLELTLARKAIQEDRQEQARLLAEERSLRTTLLRIAGRAAGEDLPIDALLSTAESASEKRRLERFARTELAKKHRETERLLTSERAALELAEGRLSAWQKEWQQASEPLGLGASPTPLEVQAYLSRLGELASAVREQREMQRRVDGILRDTAAFAELLADLCGQYAPDLLNRPPLPAAEEFLTRARAGRDAHAERMRSSQELARRRELLSEAERRRDAARAEIDALLALSGASTLEQHVEIESRSARRRELEELVQSLEDALRGRSGGQLRALIEEVKGLDHDVLQSEIEDLDDALREVDARHQSAAREAASLAQGLEHYGTEDAADARQRAAHRRAAASHALREYLVLRAARLLLETEMFEYARDNQSPLLKAAAKLFSRLTLGNYKKLGILPGGRVLHAWRGKHDVTVGQLSNGTRAQLYLALRLASLESSLALPDPLPLVLDDLFVEFDEDRTVAAFEILGEIAQRTQVLYFTHLARDVEAASDASKRGQLYVHRLSGA